jgi:hypothetical protein
LLVRAVLLRMRMNKLAIWVLMLLFQSTFRLLD